MAVTNGYCLIDDFKNTLTAPGQDLVVDAADDRVIRNLIERASRRVDGLMGMGRVFYPYIQTRYYDIPKDGELWLENDLLAVITLTNGDATTISSADYYLLPNNQTPYYALTLTDVTSVVWSVTSSGGSMRALSLNGIWGYREDYSVRGWKLGSTLSEVGNLNATDLTFTLTSGASIREGMIIKIENELMQVTAVSTNDVTVAARGDNGSTAATHANGTSVYYWTVQADIEELTLEIARIMYRARYGENVETTSITTPAGIITNPRSLPVWANEVIAKYRKRV